MINFYSDTKTKPTPAMRAAMAEAEVGDEQAGEDPTTNRLTARVAELMGHEAGVFLPSGTMCNEIAIRVHCTPGDEVIADETAHVITAEGGGPAALSGVMVRPVQGRHGVYTAAQMEAAIRYPSRYTPTTRLVVVEQTSNLGGGTVWPLETVSEVVASARRAGLKLHMDGARLMNAVVKSGRTARDHAGQFDSAWLDLSKGLGCPVGAVLTGSRGFIDAAWRHKQMWGGAMRQSGILAAAGLHALDHHVDRLADDHALAHSIAERLHPLPGVSRVSQVETNIIFFDLADDAPGADVLAERVGRAGVKIGPFGPRRVRIVTHLDVDAAAGDQLIAALERALVGPVEGVAAG